MTDHKNSKTDWFEEWFNSEYYHKLYKNRDHQEAQIFISNLINFLSPKSSSYLVDIACGKGRHAKFLNSLGFKTDGYDLSKNSISSAKEFENDSLSFYVNDIRTPLKLGSYDYGFNLFTSFGYFDDEDDNIKSIQAMKDSLNDDGVLIIDFMNCKKVIENLAEKETKVVENVTFNLTRGVINGFITKKINFTDRSIEHNYEEKVKVIFLDDFKSYFDAAKLKIEGTFGDYNLNPFNENESDRLILIARKK